MVPLGNANISGKAAVFGKAHVSGSARVFGNAWVFNDAHLYSDTHVCGCARVGDYVVITGNANSAPACPAAMW